jgi:hypothetical protein
MDERVVAPEPSDAALPDSVLPDPERVPMPRWVTTLLTVCAVALLPWTVWLTFTLPSRHVTTDYDVAWVGFDVALVAAFAATSWCAVRGSEWLVPLAAATGTMLVCDAWFDITTSAGGTERLEALLEAVFVELPLAAACAFIVYDAERFRHATVVRYASAIHRLRSRGAAPK